MVKIYVYITSMLNLFISKETERKKTEIIEVKLHKAALHGWNMNSL